MSLKQDLAIDIQRLDAEWVKIPQLYFNYREEADYVESVLSKRKLELDNTSAAKDKVIRQSPKTYLGTEKFTEAMVKAFLDCDGELIEIKEEILELTRKKRLLASAISALEMKRDTLKNLTQLYSSEYFASRPTDGLGEISVSSRKDIRREIKNKLGDKDEN